MGITKIRGRIEMELIELYEGYRNHIHPKLDILDTIDCKVFYSKAPKFFLIEYDRNKKEKGVVYNKELISNNPISISITIEKFKKNKGA